MYGLICYAIIGVLWASWECHNIWVADDASEDPKIVALSVALLMVHLFRAILTWPLYMAEDCLLLWCARLEEEEDG